MVEAVESKKMGQLLKARREELGLTQEEVALRAGVSPSLVAKLEQGRQDIWDMKVSNFVGLARALQLDPIHLRQLFSDVEQSVLKATLAPATTKTAPVLGEAAAGKPFEYPIPADLYRPTTAIFFVSGDSMDDGTEDAIREGDMVLVDTSVKELKPGGLYVLEIVGDGYTLKEARKLNGEWVFMPWNPKHPAVCPDEVKVVGKVYAVNRFRTVRR